MEIRARRQIDVALTSNPLTEYVTRHKKVRFRSSIGHQVVYPEGAIWSDSSVTGRRVANAIMSTSNGSDVRAVSAHVPPFPIIAFGGDGSFLTVK
ncbi:unnamed protein product, partial [Nesidiocoris tenuis]